MSIRLFEKNRTYTVIVLYSLYLYFLGLSLRNTSKALDIFDDEKRSHIAVWNWIQRIGSLPIYNKRKIVSAFIIDETVIQIGWKQFWLWICIEPIHKSVLGIYISEERNMFVAENFIRSLVEKYGRHQFIQMVEHSIPKLVVFYIQNLGCIHYQRKVLLKG
jgi:putative transposase